VITLVWTSEEFPLQKFGLGPLAKFSFGVYSGEAKGSVPALFVTFVCFWSFLVLLRDRQPFVQEVLGRGRYLCPYSLSVRSFGLAKARVPRFLLFGAREYQEYQFESHLEL
jgi:hypothetical protein